MTAPFDPLELKVIAACKAQTCSNDQKCFFTTWPPLHHGICFDPNTLQACEALDVYNGTCVVPQSFVHVRDLHDADTALLHQIFEMNKLKQTIHQSLSNALADVKANSQINPFG